MIGKILKPLPESGLYGVGPFFAMWQTDAAKALGECIMGDRDSHPGQYIHRLIEDGYLDANEVEQAALEWLSNNLFRDKYGQLGFDEIISLPRKREPRFQKISSVLASRFDELYPMAKKMGIDGQFLIAAAMAEDLNVWTWKKIDAIFKEEQWTSIGLFEELYFESLWANPADRQENSAPAENRR